MHAFAKVKADIAASLRRAAKIGRLRLFFGLLVVFAWLAIEAASASSNLTFALTWAGSGQNRVIVGCFAIASDLLKARAAWVGGDLDGALGSGSSSARLRTIVRSISPGFDAVGRQGDGFGRLSERARRLPPHLPRSAARSELAYHR
jgi:hypothetical protein